MWRRRSIADLKPLRHWSATGIGVQAFGHPQTNYVRHQACEASRMAFGSHGSYRQLRHRRHESSPQVASVLGILGGHPGELAGVHGPCCRRSCLAEDLRVLFGVGLAAHARSRKLLRQSSIGICTLVVYCCIGATFVRFIARGSCATAPASSSG
jgi:hypothetical protein